MARVYLDAADVFTINNNNALVYGSTGTEVVIMGNGVSGAVFDQNIEHIMFASPRSSYTFQQAGNQLLVYSGSTLLSRTPLQDDSNGTQFTFADGTVDGKISATGMTLGGVTLSNASDTTAPTVSSFTPSDGSIGIAVDSNISLTFSEAIQRGSGSIQLHSGSATGTVVETFDAASSSRLSISGSTLTVDPISNLSVNTQYFLTFAAGTIKDLGGNSYAGTTSYDFKTTAATTGGSFNIVINYTGDLTYKPYFDAAKALWEKVIITDVPDYDGVDDLEISASVTSIDGSGGILGQAGPTSLRMPTFLPYRGTMELDSDDMASMVRKGTLTEVISHEMGHVLGFGTLWDNLNLNTVFAQYTGANALAEYRMLSGNSSALYVPLETEGGTGTADSHWSDSLFGSELMTGYAEPVPPMPLSRLTIAAMKDLGYGVDFSAAESYALPSPRAQVFEDVVLTGVSNSMLTL